jgi:HAD superfamily hydrolase (TIGR01549 family)
LKYDAALFDLGGTLIIYENEYSWKELALLGCRNARPVLKELSGAELPAERIRSHLLQVLDDAIQAHSEDLAEIDLYEIISVVLGDLGVEISDGLPAKFVDSYYQPTTDQIVLVPGAVELLSKLKGAGLKIGLISNSIFPAKFHRDEMQRFGILDYFDFTIFSSEVMIRKPNEEIYLKALSLAKSQSERTVFVGDRLIEDVAGPQAVGIKAILKFDERRDYSDPVEPYRTVHSLDELGKIILE